MMKDREFIETVLAAIEKRERATREPQNAVDQVAGPDAVARACQAQRELVEAYVRALADAESARNVVRMIALRDYGIDVND
ncbi:MAG TPA: hypothetical protein VGX25_00590 [Actinophytocola sp.]|uniref:hypothetical protein n=1 Tax=Actinophytocola sp. TaxID=1872138 RepID=UPI002DDD3AE2|nr:hypothetical protein [Actinophytocola sp.]HEV2777876.1 hypothetical protein [Actinophytocola sp.]